jgi:hypothetical protein
VKARRPKAMYESKASGQRAWIRSHAKGTVFIRLEPQGSNSAMSLKEFSRLYRVVSGASYPGRHTHRGTGRVFGGDARRNARGRFTRVR